MSDVFREVDEELQQDRVKRLWHRYGTVSITVMAVILAGVAGWTWWQNDQLAQSQARTAELLSATVLIDGDPARAAQALAALGQQDGSLATLARLFEAGVQIHRADTETAIALFDQIAGDTDTDPLWRDAAILQSAVLQVGRADPAVLSAMVDPLRGDDRPFRHTADEVAAAIALDAGDIDGARLIYERLAEDAATPGGLRQRADQMLAALGS